jgi:leucyl aminopeptidase
MKLSASNSSLAKSSEDLVFVVVTRAEVSAFKKGSRKPSRLASILGRPASEALKARVQQLNFEGKHLSTLGFANGDTQYLIIGWELKSSDVFEQLAAFRKLGHMAFEEARKMKAARVAFSGEVFEDINDSALGALWEALNLSGYRFDRYKSEKAPATSEIKSVRLNSGLRIPKQRIEETENLCEAIRMARDLVNMPPCDCTPDTLRDTARRIARAEGLECEIYDRRRLEKMGAGGILSVAQGSDKPAYLIKLTYKPRGRAPGEVISIVGKGITFDSGGLSIKPAGSMEAMKNDMAGAAAVIGCMQVIGRSKPSVEVRAYIPTCENMINGAAMRPGDVFKAMNGKTVEVLNTDAEGRLILADALSLAEREQCDWLVDLATLTGACLVALGDQYAGLFSNDEELAAQLLDASRASGERLWRMPLAPEYRDLIKSPIADIKNTGGRYGGAITAALFLKEFVGKARWAHLDIAGPGYSESEKGHIKRGGTGFGIGTLYRFINARSKG